MKKIFKSTLAVAIAAFAFTGCSDVPEPYQIPGTGGNNGNTQDESTYINETFATSFGVFTVNTIKGKPWIIDFKTAKATGYADGATTESESYLVSPEIDLSASTGAYLEFQYIQAYVSSSGDNKVLITKNYNESAPGSSDWQDITGTLTPTTTKDWTTFYKYSQNIPAEFIGQKGVRIAFFYNCTSANSKTWEIKNVKLAEGTSGSQGGQTAAAGKGTAEEPYNVAAAQELIASLGADVNSQDIYVKGKIVSIKEIDTGTYGNATYYISDDGTATNQLTVFRGLGLGNKKFTASDEIKVGDDVIVYGKVVNFKGNTPEFTTGNYIYSLNGKTEGGGGSVTPITGEATGKGTLAEPYNVVAAHNLIQSLGADVKSEEVYVTGKIVSIKEIDTGTYGNATYYISDDGTTTNQLTVFRCLSLGNKKFTSANEIKVGDVVVLCGKLVNYKGNTPETVQNVETVSILVLTY